MYNNYQAECHIALATLVGAVIGFERELRGKAAGIRTYAIVAMASCLFAIVSLTAGGTHDSTRIAAQIVSGIGFLGAGTIMRDRAGVKGLTTAASLWVVSAVGLAVGCGFYSAAIFSTVLTLVVLMVLRNVERIILDKEAQKTKER